MPTLDDLEAALDAYESISDRVGMCLILNPRCDCEEWLQEQRAARAAVVAGAVPAIERAAALEKVAMTARSVWICDLKHPDSPHREACIQTRTDLYAALLALDGEPEDAGAGEGGHQ